MFSFHCNSNSVFLNNNNNNNNNNRGLLKLNYNGKSRRRDYSTLCSVSIRRKPLLISASSTDDSSTTDTDIDTNNNKLVSLPERKAVSMAKRLQLRTSTQESNLELFSSYGLTDIHFHTYLLPILCYDTIKILKPKLEYFSSIGLSDTEFVDFLSKNPYILMRSLENHIVPSIAFLKTILHTDTNFIKTLKRNPMVINMDLHRDLAPKIAILKAHGVSDFYISWLLKAQPRTVLQTSVDRFDEIVKQVDEMGFDPSKSGFVCAVLTLQSMKKSIWERKLDVFRKWGWSEEDIHMAFMKKPVFMTTSDKKINKIMDYLVNEIGCDPFLIAQHPIFLTFSLEKRIIPRCSVLKILRSNGLFEKDRSLSTMLSVCEQQFLSNYVTKFEEQVPGLLNVYRKKVNSLGL